MGDCHECMREVKIDDLIQCGGCSKTHCRDCGKIECECQDCGWPICIDCIGVCSNGNECKNLWVVCKGCVRMCSCCGEMFCDMCLSEFGADSGMSICYKCLEKKNTKSNKIEIFY
jgi:hypothetical protein